MEQLVQCPVCTLYLHNGMSLESHLDTHPKDQVIKALCSLSANNGFNSSRTSTPNQSERSFRSRSRTPATEDAVRWNSGHRNDSDRYWCRNSCRTPKSLMTNISRNETPTSDIRVADINYENSTVNNSSQFNGLSYSLKNDKSHQKFNPATSMQDFEQQYVYYQDQQEDKEIKYSHSAEYSAIDNANNLFPYNIPSVAPSVKLQTTMVPTVSRRANDLVKLLPKPNNLIVKANVGGVQYINPRVKPMHVMVPTPTFVQKNVQNNMILTGNIPTTQYLESKTVTPGLPTTQFKQINTSNFNQGTTVVTQNSQIIYREMVHNIDGKPFMSSVPAVLSSHDNINNVSQSTSMYQNVMVVDQFGNTSCMYASPQTILQKPIYNDNIPACNVDKSLASVTNDSNKTLIIEVGPILPQTPIDLCSSTTNNVTSQPEIATSHCHEIEMTVKNETPGSSKGLKILSNIKVEVPVQHNKNMLNTVVDLTGPNEQEYTVSPKFSDSNNPDIKDDSHNDTSEETVSSRGNVETYASNTFSVIKNVGNPPSYKDSKSSISDKIETEFSDSCPVPDLICNEKPSISPCSELSEYGETSIENTLTTPKCQGNKINKNIGNGSNNVEKPPQIKFFKNNPLRLNNLYVKKHKKILQIKNAKPSIANKDDESVPTSSSCKSPENFTMNRCHTGKETPTMLQTVSVERIENNDNEFDADTEEQSMDIEPVAPSTLNDSQFTNNIAVVDIKEENNMSNEGVFSNNSTSDRIFTPLESSIRPVNVITYGNMTSDDFDDDSNHKELLDLEAASKSKQFVNMMNDNYFGDNIYADYFNSDRVESFDEGRVPSYSKDGPRDGMYIWGEPSQRENEFVLPNFIHESYKIAESSCVDYSDLAEEDRIADGDRDSKADVLSESRSDGEAPLDICADEKMPPRGELSGQESNGDMESPWNAIYPEVTPAEPYDLMARESWISDGSDMDTNDKRDTLEDELSLCKSRMYTCSQCCAKFPILKELRTHKALAHAMPTCSAVKTYSRMVSSRVIKKEEKPDDSLLANNLLSLTDSKEAIAKTMLQVYDAISEPKLEGIIKQENKKKRKDYTCPTCKVDQLTDAAFHEHLKIHPLECLTCGKCFTRRANLLFHIKTHLGIKNYKCDLCEKRFITRQKLMEHHNTHTGRTPIKCTICDDTFRRYSNMVQHRNRHHFQKKAKVRDYVCHCGAVFHSIAKLKWHKETHEEKPKACPYCSEKFIHSSSLTRHVRRTHNEYFLSDRQKGRVENVPCPVCKQVYLRTNLRTHLLTHSGKRPFVCIICNKAFTTKWNLKLHRWTHMSRSAKPYKCSLCKGAFIRHTEYISHMNAHKSVRPYTCNYCGCQFIRKYNCQRHVREHAMSKKYVCKVPECGKSFHRSYYLSEHMKVHSGVRPFSCNICGKTSSNKSNHNKHVKIHHAREPVATEA